MSWSAHLQHTEAGLALTFAAPISRLDMAPDVAAHLASLLAVEARHRMRGVVVELARPVPVKSGHPLCCDCDTCLNGQHHD